MDGGKAARGKRGRNGRGRDGRREGLTGKRGRDRQEGVMYRRELIQMKQMQGKGERKIGKKRE